MEVETKREKKFKNISVDVLTLAKLKFLSGPLPVATYIRRLTLALDKENPVSMDDLGSGYLGPIRRDLDNIKELLLTVDHNTHDFCLKLLKNIVQLRVMGQFTLDAIEEITERKIKEDLLNEARSVADKQYEEVRKEFFPDDA